MNYFTQEQLQAAKKADLYDYLITRQGQRIIREGASVRLKDNHSICVKKGWTGYNDFEDKGGSGIDLLTTYFNFTIVEAVQELAGRTTIDLELVNKPKEITLPDKAPNNNRVIAYLESRGIPPNITNILIKQGLIYEGVFKGIHNAIFVNSTKTYYEVTGMMQKRFKSKDCITPKEYWCMTVGEPQASYICESAIDAISLYLLNGTKQGNYISTGGCKSQQAIDAIQGEKVIAFDNDSAGMTARRNNPNLESIEPKRKDWNEDLQAEVRA